MTELPNVIPKNSCGIFIIALIRDKGQLKQQEELMKGLLLLEGEVIKVGQLNLAQKSYPSISNRQRLIC